MLCPKSLDTKDSPRPLKDPYAPRPEGSSIYGYYPHDKGKSYATSSARASPGSYQSSSDVDDADETMAQESLLGISNQLHQPKIEPPTSIKGAEKYIVRATDKVSVAD